MVEEILEAVTLTGDDVSFEELQSIFLNWRKRLEWVTENGEEYYTA
jgi:hypothetical protein